MAKTKSPKEQHPLYHSWNWMRRMSAKFTMADSWKNDFYSFVEDMGTRPSPQHRIYRKDITQGYSKENCYWDETIPCQDTAQYQREWRKKNPDLARNHNLKKMFGLTLEQYTEMLTQQNGVCAICEQPEQASRYKYLSVDHCHTSGKIRGLLCSNCNRGLGLFRENKRALKKASDYLEKHNP
jgi:hypothetical protein